jgi:hypothetical protein
VEKTVKDFREIFEITKVNKRRNIGSQGSRVMLMQPESSIVESFTIGFSGTVDTTEVKDKFECGEWVMGPC